MANQVTGAKILLPAEGPFPHHSVDMRKITGTGMCYIQAGTYHIYVHTTCDMCKLGFCLDSPEKNAHESAAKAGKVKRLVLIVYYIYNVDSRFVPPQ